MTGIIHFSPATRVSRRAMIAGATALAMTAPARLHAQTPDASPVSRGGTYLADARDRLVDMLSLVPTLATRSQDPASPHFDWVDLNAHFAASGITDPYADESQLVATTSPLSTTDPLFQYGLFPEIPELVGFRPFDVHQVLVTGAPPARLVIYRGGIDTASMPAFWESAGYERKRGAGSGSDFWTIGENGEFELTHPLQRLVFSDLNNVAILDDEAIAFTATAARLEAVLALLAGDGRTAEENEDLQTLVAAMPSDAINVIALPGDAFLATGIVPENPGMDSFTTVQELLAESDEAVGPMPEIEMALVGVTAGVATPEVPDGGGTPIPQGNPEAQAFMLFLTGSEAAAASAATVAYWRLENMTSPTTGEVYSERFLPSAPVEEAVEGKVMVIRYTGWPATSGGWRNMILSRDSWPFIWLPD